MPGIEVPVYLDILEKKLFDEKIKNSHTVLRNCRICPRHCDVNRIEGELGDCRTAYQPIISSYFPHFGEESPLVGHRGSGTIFISSCNLQCLFCQNYPTSRMQEGNSVTIERFAEMMLELQEMGCHNINFVTPSHVIPQIIAAVKIAAGKGLRLPLVYNSSGYDSLTGLKLLEGLIDIYMPDFKFFNDKIAAEYTTVADYATVAKKAIREMHRQVGDLDVQKGVARHGLLIRHLVMPGLLDDSKMIFNFIAKEISDQTYINVMPQYRPAGKAHRLPEINRPLKMSEFQEAVNAARAAGLTRLDKPGF